MASIEKYPSVKVEPEVTGALPITAEAVMREYESAAKEIEAMGTELISVAKNCEATSIDVRNLIRDTAEAYRQEGRKERFRAYIEECALFTEDVRKTCEDVKRRLIEGNGGAQ